MRIEFVGPPGAGKTTLYRALGRNPGKLKPIAPTPGPHPFLDHVRASYSRATYRQFMGETTERIYWVALAADQHPKLLWFDQMLAQRGLALGFACPHDYLAVMRYFELMPPPHLTVVVTGDVETIQVHNRERGAKGGRDRGGEAAYMLELTKLARGYIQGRKVVVDCAEPVEANVEAILEAAA